MSFKDNLKSELEYQGLQIKELSAKCGISKNTLGNYLTGHNSVPSAYNAVKIAQALGVSVEYLVNGLEPEKAHAVPLQYKKLIDTIFRLDDIDLKAVTALVEQLQKRHSAKE